MPWDGSWWKTTIKGWRTRGSFGISSLLLGTNPNPWISHLAEKKRDRGTEDKVFLEEAQAAPLEHTPWAGSWLWSCWEEAVGSVFPGVSTQLPVDISGQHRTRPPLSLRGCLQLSLLETRRHSEGVRVAAPQEHSSPGFASSQEILDSRIRVHPLLPHEPPSPSLLSHREEQPTCILQSIPRCTQMMISLYISQGVICAV